MPTKYKGKYAEHLSKFDKQTEYKGKYADVLNKAERKPPPRPNTLGEQFNLVLKAITGKTKEERAEAAMQDYRSRSEEREREREHKARRRAQLEAEGRELRPEPSHTFGLRWPFTEEEIYKDEPRTRRGLETGFVTSAASEDIPLTALTSGGTAALLKRGMGAATMLKAGVEEFVSDVSLGGTDVVKAIPKVARKIGKIGKKMKLDPVGKELLKTASQEALPKYAGSINLEKMNIPIEQKKLLLETAVEFPKRIQSHEETIARAESIYKNYDKMENLIKKAGKQQALNPEELTAIRQLNADATKSFHKLVQTTNAKEIPAKMDDLYKTIFKARSEASSIAGKALEAHKIEIPLDQLGKAFANLSEKQKKSPWLWEKFRKLDLDNPLEVMEFVERIPDPKFRDYFYSYWYNSILSGIPTHMVNIASNTAWMAFQVPHKVLTAGIDKMITKFSGKERQYFLNELVPMMAGMKKGFTKGREGAWEMIKTGKSSTYESKWTREIGSTIVDAFERSPHKGLRKIAPLVTTPSRGLRAMDVWANSIAYDGSLRAIARREGMLKKFKGLELKQFEKKLLENPTKLMKEKAEKFARYATFMDEPGKITKQFLKLREVTPGGRLIVPFVNTLANLTKRGVEMTPGIGVAAQLAGRKMGATHPVQEIIAKQIEGSILAYVMLNKAEKGDIVGAAPENKAERETFYQQGKIPWSIKIGDKYYSYRRIEPFNTIMASASIFYDKILKAADGKTKTAIFTDFAKEIKNNLIDAPYFAGVQTVLNRHQQLEKLVPRMTTSLVPYSGFWRSINRAYEVATKGEAVIHDTSSLLGALSSIVPGLDVEPESTRFGEKKKLAGGVFRQWFPYKYSEIKHDAVENLFMEIGYHPGMPKKGEMSPMAYEEYLKEFGRLTRLQLENMLKVPAFNGLDREKKIKLVDSLVRKARFHAKRKWRKANE